MLIDLSRRGFLIGALFAPAIVRAGSIMPVRDPHLVRGVWRDRSGPLTPGGLIVPDRSFHPTPVPDSTSLRWETVWLHESHPAVQQAYAAERRFYALGMGGSGAKKEAAQSIVQERREAWLKNPANAKRLAAVYGRDEITPEILDWTVRG